MKTTLNVDDNWEPDEYHHLPIGSCSYKRNGHMFGVRLACDVDTAYYVSYEPDKVGCAACRRSPAFEIYTIIYDAYEDAQEFEEFIRSSEDPLGLLKL